MRTILNSLDGMEYGTTSNSAQSSSPGSGVRRRVETTVANERENRDAMSARAVRSIPIEDLLRGQKEVIIKHGQEEYRLRMTSNSKLILTK